MAGKHAPSDRPKASDALKRSFGDDVRAPRAEAPARRSFSEALRRQAARVFPALKPAAERPLFDLSAPLQSLFAHGEKSADGGNFSLSFSLRQSADAIEQGKFLLGRRAGELLGAINARRDGELTLSAHSLRLLIGLAWVFIGFRLDRQALAAVANGASMIGAMPIADAHTIARLFIMLGALGFGAAFVGGWFVMATGGGGNERLKSMSARLGAEAADLARKFDANLDRLREQMEERGASSPDAVEDLSRMHLTALEATAFFHNAQFLTDPDFENAQAKFRGFLRENSASSGEVAPALPLIAGLGAGALFGLLIGYSQWASPVVASVAAAPAAPAAPLMAYPWAAQLILGLAIVYAAAGRLLAMFAGPLTASTGRTAEREALEALRAAFVAGNPPRIEDVIRRIEDAMAVYKARFSRFGADSGVAGHHSAAEEDLPWRKAPEAPRFVPQNFEAAPASFRADAAPAKKSSKFLFGGRPDAAPKQSFEAGETPPWLKD